MYGQTADECADAYLHYGKTLLGLARQEIGVFWNAVKESKFDTFFYLQQCSYEWYKVYNSAKQFYVKFF